MINEKACINDIGYYKITIPSRPVAKSNMYGVRVIGKRGVIYTSRQLEDFEIMVGKIVEECIPEVLSEYQSAYVRVYQHGKKWIDIDNSLKAILDGMDNSKTIKRGKKSIQVCSTGIANDRLFQFVAVERIIVESAEEQRVEVIIAPYRGIFHFANIIREVYGIEDDYYENLILPDV